MKKAIGASIAAAICGYVAAWAIGFVFLVGDWRLVPQYIVWCWTGGGERAVYLQLFGLIAAALSGLFGLLWGLYRANERAR